MEAKPIFRTQSYYQGIAKLRHYQEHPAHLS